MIQKLYAGLCAVCVVLAVLCFPLVETRVGTFFFGVLAFCTGCMVFLYQYRKKGKYSNAAKWLTRIGNAVFVLWLCSVAVIEGLILSGCDTDAGAYDTDCIVILGGGIQGDQPGPSLKSRLAVGLDLMQKNPDAQVIVCGGQSSNEICSEASVMYTWLVQHGANGARITMESESSTTIENLENAIAICAQKHWSTDDMTVVSNEFHLYRTRRIMQKLGLTPCAAAAPSASAHLRFLMSFREYFSVIKLYTGSWYHT